MTKGVNYASAGAGVIFSSGSELGQRISFTQQIQQFMDTLQSFILNMGEAAANELISNSVFYVSIGVNDYIHYYLRNVSNIQNLYLPWSFNQFVAAAGNKELVQYECQESNSHGAATYWLCSILFVEVQQQEWGVH